MNTVSTTHMYRCTPSASQCNMQPITKKQLCFHLLAAQLPGCSQRRKQHERRMKSPACSFQVVVESIERLLSCLPELRTVTAAAACFCTHTAFTHAMMPCACVCAAAGALWPLLPGAPASGGCCCPLLCHATCYCQQTVDCQ
jgi:hypothetical protein